MIRTLVHRIDIGPEILKIIFRPIRTLAASVPNQSRLHDRGGEKGAVTLGLFCIAVMQVAIDFDKAALVISRPLPLQVSGSVALE